MLSNLEYLKVFYYVAELKSMTLAAKELNISQPAVTQSVKALESTLNTNLVYRSSHGIKLTAEGELFFNYVSAGYKQMELGEKMLLGMDNLEFGEVSIGASDMTLQFFLLPFLEHFHEKYPGIKVKVTNGPTPETINSLREGKIDFGIVSSPIEESDEFEIIPVRQIEDVFVAGRKFISLKNKTLDLSELEELPLICLEENTSSRSYMDMFLQKNGVNLKPEFELATSDMIVQFALKNLGIGCVVKDFAKPYLDEGKLFELRFNKMIEKRSFCLIKSKKIPLTAITKSMLKLISDDRKGLREGDR